MKKTSFAALLAFAFACAQGGQAAVDSGSSGVPGAPASSSAAVKTTAAKQVNKSAVAVAAAGAPKSAVNKKAAEAQEAAEAALIEQFVALQDNAISTFLGLGKTLRGVTDLQSADAAAPAVKQAGENLFRIITRVESLGEPSEAAQQAIMARVANEAEKNKIVEQVMMPLLTLMMQNPPCYGSEALNSELNKLLTNLQGTAGAEEDEGEEEVPAPLQEPDGDEAQHAPGHN